MQTMKKFLVRLAFSLISFSIAMPVAAQFNTGRAIGAAIKGIKAATITDEQLAAYVHQSVVQMDSLNQVLPEDNPYTIRLRKLTQGITEADGIPLNFKVYYVTDVNAFACPDGSVRVFAALMDLMNDDELLGVIGHEIGHVLKHHSKKSIKQELLTDAFKDAVASTGNMAAALTDSQLAQIGTSLMSAKYSQKQEKEADDCGYDFLVAQGKNPYGMAMSFEKLLSLEQQSGVQQSYIQKMFSSHPDTKARIERIEKRAKKDGYTRPESK